jgi:hypothetical protein
MSDKSDREDMDLLLQRPEFLRFLFRVIQTARIFQPTADGSDPRNLHEGRRNLGLEILEMAEAAQPQSPSPDIPATTLLQVLLEEARQPQTEKPNAKARFNRTDELNEPDEPDA